MTTKTRKCAKCGVVFEVEVRLINQYTGRNWENAVCDKCFKKLDNYYRKLHEEHRSSLKWAEMLSSAGFLMLILLVVSGGKYT